MMALRQGAAVERLLVRVVTATFTSLPPFPYGTACMRMRGRQSGSRCHMLTFALLYPCVSIHLPPVVPRDTRFHPPSLRVPICMKIGHKRIGSPRDLFGAEEADFLLEWSSLFFPLRFSFAFGYFIWLPLYSSFPRQAFSRGAVGGGGPRGR